MVEQPNAPAATAWRVSAHVTALYPGTCSLSSPQYFGQRRPQAVGRDSTIKTLASFHPSNHRGGNWNQTVFVIKLFRPLLIIIPNHPALLPSCIFCVCQKPFSPSKVRRVGPKHHQHLVEQPKQHKNIKPSPQAGVSFRLRSAIHTAGGQNRRLRLPVYPLN